MIKSLKLPEEFKKALGNMWLGYKSFNWKDSLLEEHYHFNLSTHEACLEQGFWRPSWQARMQSHFSFFSAQMLVVIWW